MVAGIESWHAPHSTSVPSWPWIWRLAMLSLAFALGKIACVDPWHASHWRPPWPVENLYRLSPAAGVSGLVAKVVSAGTRRLPSLSNAFVKRIWPLFEVAVPVWQPWHAGCSSHPTRAAAPTVDIDP